MKKIVLASIAALTFATPSFAASFSGPRVGATIGLADDDFLGTEVFTYGLNAGYDVDLGTAVVGGTVEWQDSDEDILGRDLSVTARVGAKVNDTALVYGLVGYTNLSVDDDYADLDVDGLRAGVGIEIPFGTKLYGQLETRYSDYELGLEVYQTVIGVGFRF